jgi:F-type H+-transporting ATPase subunit b
MLIDWFTVGAQAFNFVGLVWLLQHFLYKPVLAAIDARDKNVATQVNEAATKVTEAEAAKAEFQKKNQQFDEQRQSLTDEAVAELKAQKEERDRIARQESADSRALLHKSVQAEHNRMLGDLKSQVQQEVVAMAEKVLKELADTSLEKLITKAFLKRLQDLPSEKREPFRCDGSQPAVMRSSTALTDEQQTEMSASLQDLLGPKGCLKFEVRSEMIAGIELVSNGLKLDWNLSDCIRSISLASEETLHAD